MQMKMASSQVEIASSAAFGCVLKDHNRHERCSRESNVRAALERNLKVLVRDHLNNCGIPSSDENSHTQIDSWVTNNPQRNLRCPTNSNHNNNNKEGDSSSSPNSANRQPRLLDRRPAARTADRQRHEAQRVQSPTTSNPQTASSLSVSLSVPSPRILNSRRENNSQSPRCQWENSQSTKNLGASSLVQIWEARLNQSNSINQTGENPSIQSNTENGISNYEEPSRGSEMGESVDLNGTNNEEATSDWESQSDKTQQSEPPCSSHGRRTSVDSAESERVRIVDIIKRLTSCSDDSIDHEQANGANESPSKERRYSSGSDQAEQRCLLQVTCSPKIRGRQAFADLLMQMEQDRHRELDSLVERQAVSRFSQRGRLQSMLRIRCLQRCTAIQDRLRSRSTAPDVTRLSQGSAVMHLREKFRTGGEHSMAAQTDAANQTALSIRMVNNNIESEKSSTSAQLNEDSHHQEVSVTGKPSTPQVEQAMCGTSEESEKSSTSAKLKEDSHHQEVSFTRKPSTPQVEQAMCRTSEDLQEEASSTSSETNYFHSQETAEATTFHNRGESERAEEEELNNQQNLCLDYQETAETTLQNGWDENETAEEQEADDQQYFVENNHDWLSDISRPRSYWEDLRQSWYQKVLNTSSEKEEIRQLLERRTVSSFLGSDMRERMDRLMISRIQLQTGLEGNREEDIDEDFQEIRNNWMLSHMERDLQPPAHSQEEEHKRYEVEVEQQEQEGEQQEEQEEQEQENEGGPFSHQFHEANNDYFSQSSSQMYSPSPMRSWSYGDQEIGDYPDRVTSTSQVSHLPSQSQSYYHDNQHSSVSINHPSTEMELVYDLRGHIEQIQREMSELRKSIKSCIDMQVKLQQSTNQEIHSVPGERKNSLDRSPLKRNCCICCEMQVDSLLYRCGHMCTCLKCAHELQWSTGKCPVCRAPIVDVVRAFMDS